ncbi:glycosyltransferase family 2 protein [Paractinoplanes atraurantiacus]|uniref:Glycosyltransferase, catalytic subunit of cellulose synthase and poly-beta-1,6-N-acetylglucosamine synthase n=1 Tax=Paractinoplanes atraurantiacus TaxID=1036182 RepID=A0A285GZM4_9ACTN|nr:glycosyltransferase family 2 protein [Actinoplanes atraurantiacus]SNY28918.1 Glycosyltransferase, catalytic subunit of cellulose synthase and poly-beta-1,6-N-acetylglucosamine synthase [Actinoplanes atraurantiacus]
MSAPTLVDVQAPETARSSADARPRRVVAIVPAYNEAAAIAATIQSLRDQTRPPDLIVVVPNNCTDDTAAVAEAAGAYVLKYPGHNEDKKAGAINFALDRLEPYLIEQPWHTAVLVMDADTTLGSGFIETAVDELAAGVGGVGGTFVARPSTTALGFLQALEFHRYGQVAKRMGYRAFVLTGTGTLFSWQALRDVREQRRRGVLLPKGASYYDTHSLTEDNELTLALQTCGYLVRAPEGMWATTDVMDTVGKLAGQRKRWYLGALRNLAQYGRRMPGHMRWTYWRQQSGLFLSAVVAAVYLIALVASLAVFGGVDFRWYWAAPTVLLLIERVATVWRMGWRARLYAAAFVPEQLYTLLLTFIYTRAFFAFVRGERGGWAAT